LRTGGSLSHETRLDLAIQAFRHTSAYDSAVYSYLAGLASDSEDPDGEASPFGERLSIEYTKVQDLRYGENPHQRAAFYRDPLCTGPSICGATQLQGKELSFNNILDLDAALSLAADIATCACTVIKHGNPCGAAIGGDPQEAFKRALECDPMSAFGGVIAFNRRVNRHAAESVAETFFEAVVAPFFDDEARHVLSRKKKLRLLECGELNRFSRSGYDLRRVNGGLLAQDWDNLTESVRESRVVTARQPTDKEWRGLEFAWTVGKHVKSNAIVFTSHDRTLGVGAGQMSRVDSARIAVEKARGSLQGSVMASDAFFPFRDGLDVAAEAGIVAVVQPGGSVRDDEVIASANEHGMTMIFTSRRHFRH
jgi:phosphoribosylaminoimidazolecarboxamide formyltransferase/IMP cyclohydrolase